MTGHVPTILPLLACTALKTIVSHRDSFSLFLLSNQGTIPYHQYLFIQNVLII